MPKIVAVPVAQAESKQTLPEPEISVVVDAEAGDIVVTATFRNVDPELFEKSKKTLYLSRTSTPVNIEFGEEGAKQVLALDTQGRQPLQFRCGLSAPFIEEKEASTNGAGEKAAEEVDEVTGTEE